jgi:hypothetical protein
MKTKAFAVLIAPMMLRTYGKKTGTKIDQDLTGMEYEGSDKVFNENK